MSIFFKKYKINNIINYNGKNPVVGELIANTDIEELKRDGLTKSQLDSISKSLTEAAKEGENRFGKSPNLSDKKPQEFIKQRLGGIISSVVETVKSQAPDLIREASLSEAVFCDKDDFHHILATDSLATCIGIAGYDPINKFGFVVHFTGKDEVEASGDMLLDRIRAYRKENSPLIIHLRGGIKGMSESTLESIREWITTANDLNSIIASENTLQLPIATGIGLPEVPGSIKLDVRTGTCETYDRATNPYSRMKNLDEINADTIQKLLIQTATKKAEIRIVFDSFY